MFNILLDDSHLSTTWLGFDKYRKSLYGYDIINYTSTSVTLELKMMNLLIKKVNIIKTITMDDGLLEINKDEVRFTFTISPSGELIGMSRRNYKRIPTNYQFCLIYTENDSKVNIYTFNDEHFDDIIAYRHQVQVMCSDINEWLIMIDVYNVANSRDYYQLIFENDDKTGRVYILTKSCCEDLAADDKLKMGNELLFDRKLIVFGTKKGRLSQMNCFDFITGEWVRTTIDNDPDVLAVVSKYTSYRTFGNSFDNLFALTYSDYILKYDLSANMWRKYSTEVINLPFRGYNFSTSFKILFNGCNLLFIKCRVLFENHNLEKYNSNDNDPIYDSDGGEINKEYEDALYFSRRRFIKVMCNVLSLKDLCVLQIANDSPYLLRSNLKEIIPISSMRDYFGKNLLAVPESYAEIAGEKLPEYHMEQSKSKVELSEFNTEKSTFHVSIDSVYIKPNNVWKQKFHSCTIC